MSRINPSVIAHVGADNIVDGQLPAYAWPGGYPLYYVTDQNTILCPEHANVEQDYNDELIDAADVNYEDSELWCEHGHRIESAYADAGEDPLSNAQYEQLMTLSAWEQAD